VKKDTQTPDLFRNPPRGCKAVDLESGRIVGAGAVEENFHGHDLKGMVRHDDHSTSVAAAVGVVKRDKSKLQREVLAAFVELGPMTDGELEALPQFAHYAYSTVRKRRTELCQRGDLVETGDRRMSEGNSPMKVWRAK
jgi:hypothetical protein